MLFTDQVKKITKLLVKPDSQTAAAVLQFVVGGTFPTFEYNCPTSVGQFDRVEPDQTDSDSRGKLWKYMDKEYGGWFSIRHKSYNDQVVVIDFETMTGAGRHLEIYELSKIRPRVDLDCLETDDPELQDISVKYSRRHTTTVFTDLPVSL